MAQRSSGLAQQAAIIEIGAHTVDSTLRFLDPWMMPDKKRGGEVVLASGIFNAPGKGKKGGNEKNKASGEVGSNNRLFLKDQMVPVAAKDLDPWMVPDPKRGEVPLLASGTINAPGKGKKENQEN